LGEAASSLVILSTHNIPHVLPIHIKFFLIIPCIVCSCYGVLLWHFFAEIPNNDYIEYFAPDYTLKVANLNMDNLNSKTYLSSIKVQVMESLRSIQHAPGVQMQEVPPDFYIPDFDEDELDPDERVDQHTQDKQIHRDDEYYEGDNDNDHDDGTR